MKREDVIQYMVSLDSFEFEIITKEISRGRVNTARRSYEQNHQTYLNKKAKDAERAIVMKNSVSAGMIVKCEGTKDNVGLREVLETNSFGIVARKLERRVDRKKDKTDPERFYYERCPYITTHNWDKISLIIKPNFDSL